MKTQLMADFMAKFVGNDIANLYLGSFEILIKNYEKVISLMFSHKE